MRKTFLVWLFVFMMVAFVSALIISFSVLTTQASENARVLILVKIEDVEKQIHLNQKNLLSIRQEADENALAKAEAAAEMIALNPLILDDPTLMERLRAILDVDEIHISDENGILIAGTVSAFFGYDYASADQSSAFLPAISNPSFRFAQDPLPRGIDQVLFQYVGVGRKDNPGIVQIGYTPDKLIRAMEVADIRNLAAGFRIGNSGSILIADRSGKIRSALEEGHVGKELSDLGLDLSLFAQTEGSFLRSFEGGNSLFAYQSVEEYLIIGQIPAHEMYFSRDSGTTVLLLFNLLLFGVIFFLIARLVQVVVIQGIYHVNDSLAKITQGHLEEKVHVDTNKEFKLLSEGINTTVNALKEAIHEAEQRIDSELAFAKSIQLSALPGPFEAGRMLEICGDMHTAKEVGGDFYDYFVIDDTKLGMIIADASGKGIPAALFMMICKSIIKTYALSDRSLEEILFCANNTLCENNETNMFVTAYMGILDIPSQSFTYACAGHNPALIQRAGQDYEWLPAKVHLALAAMYNTRYQTNTIPLRPGDKLFLYTDGVTEANDPSDALFGSDRLISFLNSLPHDIHPKAAMYEVRKEVERFAAGAEQADDITMLMLEMIQNESINNGSSEKEATK